MLMATSTSSAAWSGWSSRAWCGRRPEPGGEPRFTMLETIREYGLEQLTASGEADTMRARHATWCLALVAPDGQGAISAFGAADLAWLNRLDAEHHNLRAALVWAEECGDAETTARLAGALARFWRVRGHLREGRQWVERALASGHAVSPTIRLRLLGAAGLIAVALADYGWARTVGQEGVALAQQLGDPWGEARNLHTLGVASLDQGDYPTAVSVLEQAQALYRQTADGGFHAVALGHLGLAVAQLGDVDRAISLWEEALALGSNQFAAAYIFQQWGAVLHHRGDRLGAVDRYCRSLALWQELGDTWYLASCLTGLAVVAAENGHAAVAARLLGAAAALRESSGGALRPREEAIHERAVAAATQALGDQAFSAVWTEGSTSPLEAIIAATALLAGPADSRLLPDHITDLTTP